MRIAELCVRDFMEKYECEVGRLAGTPDEMLADIATTTCMMSQLAGTDGDLRRLRAHLMLEELGEVIDAMVKGNEVDLLDGLADLAYVVIGTAIAFRLPMADAFDEVHSSNMTKTKTDRRLRVKGPNYRPPNIAGLICKR